jgi:anti-anti-sigma factor
VGRRAVLSVSGVVDLDSVAVLADAVDGTVAAGAAELWIDLTDTEFMDAAGLGLLLATRKRLHELNRRLAIICPRGCVRRLFEVAGVTDRLPLYSERRAAHRAT